MKKNSINKSLQSMIFNTAQQASFQMNVAKKTIY